MLFKILKSYTLFEYDPIFFIFQKISKIFSNNIQVILSLSYCINKVGTFLEINPKDGRWRTKSKGL